MKGRVDESYDIHELREDDVLHVDCRGTNPTPKLAPELPGLSQHEQSSGSIDCWSASLTLKSERTVKAEI
jgi:hypothetical protein